MAVGRWLSMNQNKNIRVGVVGIKRGLEYIKDINKHSSIFNMELAAICDIEEKLLNEISNQYKVKGYTDYAKFLEHDMDAVILCNYFHEHAPFAIKALQAEKHVMSEVGACKTLGEGVSLARAVEKSNKIYLFGENYPYTRYIQEMRKLYKEDAVGEIQFGEGEYIHPCSADGFNQLAMGLDHWRNVKPATYYCTHSIGPLMYITDTRPTSVNALCIPFSEKDEQKLHVRIHDIAATIMCRMNNDAVVVLNGVSLRGDGNWFRVHGTRGFMENMRTGNKQMVRIKHNSMDLKPDEEVEKTYLPNFPDFNDIAPSSSHNGADFFVLYNFAEAIKTNKQPYHDVYKGLDMTLVGIQAYKSALANGAPFEIPDFRDENVRKRYENDNWSPYPEDYAPGQPYSSIKGKITPSQEAIENAKRIWIERPYH